MQDHPLLQKLSKKTEMFTNLVITPRIDSDPYRTFAFEAWQMGLYGTGCSLDQKPLQNGTFYGTLTTYNSG